jgi:hypothetical protein
MDESKEEKEVPPPPPPPSPPLKFYLNKSDTYLGKALLQELSAKPSESEAVMGKHSFVTGDKELIKGTVISETWEVTALIT